MECTTSELIPEHMRNAICQTWNINLDPVDYLDYGLDKSETGRENYYGELCKYLRGEPNNIAPETDAAAAAEIAKALVVEDPTLLLPANKDRLLDAAFNLVVEWLHDDIPV
jgi:hypothetical protein